MLQSKWLCAGAFLLASLAHAAKVGNYSVQLLEGLAPEGWTSKQSKQWAAVADTMIGKTQAYVHILLPYQDQISNRW